MAKNKPKRHTCSDLKRALADGFVREQGQRFALADLRSAGAPGSQFESRLYGPTIAFCPFCGAAFDEEAGNA